MWEIWLLLLKFWRICCPKQCRTILPICMYLCACIWVDLVTPKSLWYHDAVCKHLLNTTMHIFSRIKMGVRALWKPEAFPLWRHNGRDGVSNHQPHDCLLNRLFRCESKKTSRLHVTGLCAGNSPVTGEFPAQRANNAENALIWRCNHAGCSFVAECRDAAPSPLSLLADPSCLLSED